MNRTMIYLVAFTMTAWSATDLIAQTCCPRYRSNCVQRCNRFGTNVSYSACNAVTNSNVVYSPSYGYSTNTSYPTSYPISSGITPAPITSPCNACTSIQPINHYNSTVANSNVNTSVVQPQVVTYTSASNVQTVNYSQPRFGGGGGVAQAKAQRAANMRLRGHVGGSLGSGRFEGVGWSSYSPQRAIQNCCYWGQRSPVEIGVARGSDGWYACVLYR